MNARTSSFVAARIVLILGFLVEVAVVGCGGREAPTAAAESGASTQPEARATETVSYDEVLAQARDRARRAEDVAMRKASSALVLGRAAAEHMRVARLTGDYADYDAARRMLDLAFGLENAVPPVLLRAQLNASLHRLEAARQDLARWRPARPSDGDRAAAELLAANVAFAAGEYARAHDGYQAALALRETPGALAALAHYTWQTGVFDGAQALYAKSMRHYEPGAGEPRAWTHLQLGLMDLERGRLDDALAHYRDADAELPGYWLVVEHIAEVLARLGRRAEAEAIYRRVIATTRNPELMDALAELALAEGDRETAAQWIEQARSAHDERMALFPEAARGHALHHHLAFGDAFTAVQLAEANHATRPNAEAKVLLAKAYLRADRPHDARVVIDAALRTPIRTVDLHTTAAETYRALGEDSAAQEQLALARAIDPTT